MRAVILGLAATVIAGQALAADYLRGTTYEYGPKPRYRWDGWYIGAQGGWANVDFNFGTSTSSLVANLLRNTTVQQEFMVSEWPNVPNMDSRGASYGAFLGYNAQWGDVVMGVELNYNRSSIKAESVDFIGRSVTTSDNYQNDITLNSRVTAKLTDYGGMRFRAGYAMDWVMPYMMIGLGIGNTSYQRAVEVTLLQTDLNGVNPPVLFFDTASEGRNNALTIGYSAGAGVDVGLTPNLFVRGEYEFLHLAAVGGISYRVNTIRGAAALRF